MLSSPVFSMIDGDSTDVPSVGGANGGSTEDFDTENAGGDVSWVNLMVSNDHSLEEINRSDCTVFSQDDAAIADGKGSLDPGLQDGDCQEVGWREAVRDWHNWTLSKSSQLLWKWLKQRFTSFAYHHSLYDYLHLYLRQVYSGPGQDKTWKCFLSFLNFTRTIPFFVQISALQLQLWQITP